MTDKGLPGDPVPHASISATSPVRRAVFVRGVVQGVGFRPFVYRLAFEEGLAGSIGNDTDGVTIEIEGPSARVNAFLMRLRAEIPPLARIDAVTLRDLPPTGESGFHIVASQIKGQVSTGIPADAATCADCLRELLDPADRRYRYPFLNCTNCGPRFTITRSIPYDRPQTSMSAFTMCAPCQAEYDDPLNRRFHAQPNACSQCGPRVWLETPDGARIDSSDPVSDTIERLLAGHIAAIKGIGGFHLAVDATSESAVTELRHRKHRCGKPLAIMVRDLGAARTFCVLSPEEEALLQTPAHPIVLARARPANGIAPGVAPGIPWLGVFVPYAPLQHLLFADPRVDALVMTSANLSEEPIAIDDAEARTRLAAIADFFLMHDREILQRCDDSVTAIVEGAPQFLRRARGYVPLGIELPFEVPPLLAVGGHLKNVFTLARGRFAYQSQHLGDLENLTGLEFFNEALAHLTHTFEIEPELVVHDLHPGYLSTSWARKWAAERNLPLIAAQHHHAHIAACMAEHGVSEPVIGLSLDGTGYGTDGRIWGGEVLITHLDHFERYAQLEYVPMPGGEAAIREPWRMAFSHLVAAGVDEEIAQELVGAGAEEVRVLTRMMDRGLNSPQTSSCGRLFDAVAAVVLQRRTVDYDAQAAIELEGICVDEPDRICRTDIVPMLFEGSPLQIRLHTLWRAIVEDLRRGVPKPRIAARFHSTVAEAFAQAAVAARSVTGIKQVALSGGCLHNRRLAHLLRTGLEEEGFKVIQQQNVSPGDGGLSYGQAVVGAAIYQRSKTGKL
ncbi:MAG TPA: carbamoyltransferase HypF [Terracidiphilus sp.]|nr:carbamoyltransferase HypF [Terracidiphilus sp.]